MNDEFCEKIKKKIYGLEQFSPMTFCCHEKIKYCNGCNYGIHYNTN